MPTATLPPSAPPGPTDGPADLDAIFAALADPTRRAIVARLAAGEATVLELADPFDISLPAVSRHLKVLEHAGLIARRREGRQRPCRLRPEALVPVSTFVEHTREAWEQRLDRLDDFLRARGHGTDPTADLTAGTDTTTDASA